MVVNPFQPRTFLGRPGHLEPLFVVLGVLALPGLVLLVSKVRRVTPVTRAFLVLALIPLLLVLHLTPLPLVTVAADRYLYLPIAALLVALVPAVQALLAARPQLMFALLLLTGACGVRTFQRVGDYADEALFWRHALETAPGHAIPSIELGSVAYRAGLFPEALALHEQALKLDDLGSGRALDNAALLAAVTGQRELAARLGDTLVARFPRHAGYRLRRASVAFNAFDFETARAHAERSLALDPGSLEVRGLLDLIESARLATLEPGAAERLQRFEIKAQRFPEVSERLANELRPGGQLAVSIVRDALDFLVARGDPRVAEQHLRLYLERRSNGPSDGIPAELVDSWQRALRFRLETASLVGTQLRQLTPQLAPPHPGEGVGG
jgi:tetratricopeptide (TPR) repeat protein